MKFKIAKHEDCSPEKWEQKIYIKKNYNLKNVERINLYRH